MKFRATVERGGKTATGIRVLDEIVAALAGGNRPRIRVTYAGHTYATSVARRRGGFKLRVSAAVRERAESPPATNSTWRSSPITSHVC